MKKKILLISIISIIVIIIAILVIVLRDSVATDESMITVSNIVSDYDIQKEKLNTSVTIDATDEDFDKAKAIINKYSEFLNEIQINYVDNKFYLVYPDNPDGCTVSFKSGDVKKLNELACYTSTNENYFHIQDYVQSFLTDEDKENSTYNIIMGYINMKVMTEIFCLRDNTEDYIQNYGTVKDPVKYRSYATQVTDRVHSLLFMYKMTNDIKYANRLKNEILYISDWENEWISTQYLDTAEIVYDVGMAYEYLYDTLSEEELKKIETRLIESLFLYSNLSKSLSHFVNTGSNWNSVCSSGTGIGAIALMRNSDYRVYVSDESKKVVFLGIDFNEDGQLDYINNNDPDEYGITKYSSFPYIMSTNSHDSSYKDMYQLLKEEDASRDDKDKILKTDGDRLYIELKDLSALIIKSTLLSLPKSLDDNSLDGGDPEGMSYYGFAMRFFNYYTSTLYNAFGKVYNLLDISTEKMNNYMLSPIYTSDNKGEKYEYSDISVGGAPGAGAQHTTWLNNYYAYNKTIPDNESIVRDTVRLIYDWRRRYLPVWNFTQIISYDSSLDEPIDDYSFYEYVFDNTVYKTIRDNLNTDQFRMSEILTFRNSFDYDDETGFMVAIKTGDSAGSHQHLDIASYDYEIFNYKFIRDLGSGSYTTGYFDNNNHRWKYYKTRAEGHSTIVINPDMVGHMIGNVNYVMADQYRYGYPIYTQFYAGDLTSLAVLDLTNIYNKIDNNCKACENNTNDNKVKRGFQYVNFNSVMVVQDEVVLEENGDYYSFLSISGNYGNDNSSTKVFMYLFDDEDNLNECINKKGDNTIDFDNLIINDEACLNKDSGRIAILQLKEDKTKIVKVVLNSNQDNQINNLYFEKVKMQPLTPSLISPPDGDNSINYSLNTGSSKKYKLQIHASDAKNITSKVTYIPIFNSNDIYLTDNEVLPLNEWENNESNIELSSYIDYTVTFDSNGGSGVESQVVDYNGKAVEPVNPTKNGYTFAGWYSDSTLTTPFSFETAITADKTIYAKWKTITNAVKTILSPIPTTGLTIGDLTIEPEESDKYTLSAYYWKLNDSGSALSENTTIKSGKTYTLYLSFSPTDSYDILDDATFTVNGIITDWSGSGAKTNRKINFTVPAEVIQITEASATVIAPVGNAHPDFHPVVPDGANYKVVVDTWYLRESPYPDLTPKSTFKTNKEYSLKVHFVPNEGYEFADNATFTINGQSTTKYGAIGDREYSAIATAPVVTNHNVTFNLNGGTPKSGLESVTADKTVDDGEKMTLSNSIALVVNAPNGKILDALIINGTRYELDGSTYTIHSDINIKFVWKDVYKIIFDLNGGTPDDTSMALEEEIPTVITNTNPLVLTLNDKNLGKVNPPSEKIFSHYEINGTQYSISDKYTIDNTKNVTIKWVWKDDSSSSLTVDGDNQTFTLGNTNDITIICSGDLDKLTAIKVNGVVLDETNRDLSSGGTVLKLKNSYLNTLSKGTYTVTFEYGNNSAHATLNVVEATNNDDNNNTDNDNSNNSQTSLDVVDYVVITVVGTTCLAGGTVFLKKKKLFRNK